MTLLLVGLLGGLITGISPCILPVLPVIFLSGGAQGARPAGGDPARGDPAGRRPFLVVLGLAVSFGLFTLFGALVLSALHLPADLIRWLGLAVLVLLGAGLIVPAFERILERPFSLIPLRPVSPDRGGFSFGLVLGALYVPCAGPVLAAITVAGATGRVGLRTVVLTVAFCVGTALPLLVFALAGRRVAERVRAFRRHQRPIRVVSGVAMIVLAVALTFNVTDAIQRTIPDYTASINRALQRQDQVGTALGRPAADGELADCQHFGSLGLADCGPAPALAGISTWLNTPGQVPLTLAGLRGRVVLVDFWAYSCINCQRAIPHLEAWYRAYAEAGLTVIGVHSPEYAFEREAGNVAAGAKRLGITYPIAVDNDFGTWNAFANESWPTTYLIDATGTVRNVAIGEGDYGGEEAMIRTLLQQANPAVTLPAATDVPDTTPRDPDQTPELYLGSRREQGYAGADPYADGTSPFAPPADLGPGQYALGGVWTIGPESITAGSKAVLLLRYHASKVYLDVGGRGTLGVTVSGGAPRTIPVSGEPNISAVVDTGAPADGLVEITLSPGLSAYSFTFG